MILLTIINTAAILFILFKTGIIEVEIRRDETFWGNTLVGYNVWIWKKYFRIPIRNRRKTELADEINRMIKTYNKQAKIHRLTAIFSWLKTEEGVKQFKKDYSVVDYETVDRLVSNFKPKE